MSFPLSLSVRIAEGFLSKEVPILPLQDVAEIAQRNGYRALCMRASQLGIQSTSHDLQEGRRCLREHELRISMLTGNFDVVYNNEKGPSLLRDIEPYLQLAQTLETNLIRVALKSEADIALAQHAADQAAHYGIRLVHQCHTLSLFETVESIETTLRRIDRPNFGLIYEPANLELCGQDYGATTLRRLAPWIFNVYLQNQILSPTGKTKLETWCRGSIPFDIVPIHRAGGIDFKSVLNGLHEIEYQGWLTVHQSATEGETPAESASKTADYLRSIA